MRGFTKINSGIHEIKIRLTSLENEVRIAIGKENNAVPDKTTKIPFNDSAADAKAKLILNSELIPKEYNLELVKYFILCEKAKENSDYKEFSRNIIKQLERIWSIFMEHYGENNFLTKLQEEVTYVSRKKTQFIAGEKVLIEIPTTKRLLVDVLYDGLRGYNKEAFLKGITEKYIKDSEKKTFFDYLLVYDYAALKSKSGGIFPRPYVYQCVKYYKDDDSHANDPKFPFANLKAVDQKEEYDKFKKNPLELLKSESPYELVKNYYLLLVNYIKTNPKTESDKK